MRILAVNHEYTVSGASRVLFALARHLREAGHAVTISAALPRPGPLRDAYRDAGFAVLDPPFSGWFDLAICNTIFTAPIVTMLSAATRTLWWLHEGRAGFELLFERPEWRAAFAQAGTIVFVNRFQAETMFGSLTWMRPDGRCFVVPNGIAPPSPASSSGSPPESSPGSPDGAALRVVALGAVYVHKRQDDLIRAVAALRPLPLRCTLVGPLHELPDDCRALIAADPERFRLAGECPHDKAMEELARADIFCLPSMSEAMPLAALEAALLEKPMILSDLPVYGGLWRHGENCLLHPVGAVDLLAQAIAQLAAAPELRRRLGSAARRTALPFTEAAMFARFDAILAGL